MTTDRRNDAGVAVPMVEAFAERYGVAPARLLVDTNNATQDDIVALDARAPVPVLVYAPPLPERETASAATQRKRAWRHWREPPAVQAWRERMATAEGADALERRRHIEPVHGNLKTRGLSRLNVRGLLKVQCVALLEPLVHNP